MRTVVFVAPFPAETTLRFADGVARLGTTRVVGVWQEAPAEPHPFVDGESVGNALDPSEIAQAVERLASRHGKPHRLLGVLEDLQVQLAQVREQLGIEGPSVAVATGFRDKARMKELLAGAGIDCARHAMIRAPDEAWAFAREVGYPIVLKPPAGAGCRSTYRVQTDTELTEAMEQTQPSPQRAVLAEEFLQGDEHSFEAITVGGEPRFHSITRYYPTPLEAMRNPWIQWVILAPKDIYGPEYDAIREVGVRVIKALGLQDGITHMEWFRGPDGRIAVGEIAARPPGAQIVRLIAEAHQMDPYLAWARAVVDGEFDGPWERHFAVGVAFLRGPGTGRIARIDGIEEAQAQVGELVIEARLPKSGAPKSSSYEGDGFVIVRHPDTDVVKRALLRLIETVRVHYA